jgi:RHS repeat-associated protein
MQNSSSFFQSQARFRNGFNAVYYSPFGVELKGRNLKKNNAKNYRFGFNGMEADDQVKGDGNSYDFGARMLDTRLGRWLSVDPMAEKYAPLTPYNFVANSPLIYIDPNGKEIVLYDKNMKKVATVTKSGIIIEKGMENSAILKSYTDTREYFKGKDDNLFSMMESNDKTLSIFEADKLFEEEPHFTPIFDVKMDGNPVNLNNVSIGAVIAATTIEIPCDYGSIIWNPTIGLIDGEGNSHSPALIFYHELIHAKEWLISAKQAMIDVTTLIPIVSNQAEVIAIDKTNEMSKKLDNGDGGNGDDKKRTSHSATEVIRTSEPTSNVKIE